MEICYANQGTVLLIPDISGFTSFVSASNTEHGQKIIALLLESILDNNILDFEISEIEGDAVLFYKSDPMFTGNEIIHQCNQMFMAFHKVLDEFRIKGCDCDACKKLNKLSLKFIVYFGEIGSIMIKNYCKLFGKDLIVAHRLLKNNLDSNEYILLTEAFTNKFHWETQKWKKKDIEIDEIGKISYAYKSLFSNKPVSSID